MKSLRTALLATIAIFAFPSAALAEELVPPGNSAVNQYTETFPTSGGDKKAEHGKKRPKPAAVLGSHNAKKLEDQGPEGRKVATVAAATAPSTVVTPEPEETDQGESGAAGGGGGGGNRKENAAPSPAPRQTSSAPDTPRETAGPSGSDGSSGFGEVLAQATGTSSSGELGLLLPLAIVAAFIWAVATRRRTRRPAQ
jgi:hypothetical protein